MCYDVTMDLNLRMAVLERDRWCPVCGEYLAELVAVHHRKLRSQGGTDSLANLIGLHSSCHNIAPKSVHQNPALAYERGWMVRSWGDPEKWPLTLPDGRQVLLTSKYEPVKQREGEENGW